MEKQTVVAMRRMVWEQVEACHNEGMRRYSNRDDEDAPMLPERFVTQKQEIAYRLCHHDFFGLSTEDAAEVMNVDPRTVREHLDKLKEVAPQLFPILPRRSAKVHFLFTVENMTEREIADTLDISTRTVGNLLYRMFKNREQTGLYFRAGSARRISYNPWMDPHVNRSF